MKEQRRSQRFRQELTVDLHDKRGSVRLSAVDVARHGMFLATQDPPRERHMVQLHIFLPQGAIKAAATVTRIITAASVLPDQTPGVGLQFFALSDGDKAAWDDFIFSLTRTTPTRGTPRPALPAPARSPLNMEAGATFIVKLKNVARLHEFADGHLGSGGTVLFTPVLRARGEHVTLVVVHPVTDEEFRLPGVVTVAHEQKPRRLEIRFLGLTPHVTNAFRAYIESGKAPPIDLQPARPPQPGRLPPTIEMDRNNIDLNADVLDENTLDTDEPVDLPFDASNVAASAFTRTRPASRARQIAPASQAHDDDLIEEAARGFSNVTTKPVVALPLDPQLAPAQLLVSCSDCTAPAYAVELGPCRGVLGLVADLLLFSTADGRLVAAPRLVDSAERARRVQQYLSKGGQLGATVDLVALLGAVALADQPADPDTNEPLRRHRAIERLEAAAVKLETAHDVARSKVKCPACRDGTVAMKRVPQAS